MSKVIKIKKIKKKEADPIINIKNENKSNIKNDNKTKTKTNKNNNLNKQLNLEEDTSIAYKPIDEISNKISNFINKNDEMIEPLSWVLPNKKEFINWISQTFFKYRADGKKLPAYKGFKPFK